jgi:hypothetical protein
LAGFLGYLVKFGPVYMEPHEFRIALESHLRIYYRFLGRSILQRRSRQFWTFHRQKMAELGYPMNRWRVFLGLIVHIADIVLALNHWPYVLLKRLGHLLRRRQTWLA